MKVDFEYSDDGEDRYASEHTVTLEKEDRIEIKKKQDPNLKKFVYIEVNNWDFTLKIVFEMFEQFKEIINSLGDPIEKPNSCALSLGANCDTCDLGDECKMKEFVRALK